MPLVGADAGKFDMSGIEPVVGFAVGLTITGGTGRPTVGGVAVGLPKTRVIGLVPTAPVPPKILLRLTLAVAMPNCVPISLEKLRVAETMRASISTCCALRSRWR